MKSEKQYYVNPLAESVGSVLATIIFIITMLVSFALIGFGVVQVQDGDSSGYYLMGGGIVLLVVGVISWAFLRIIINISRSLYNINDALRSQNIMTETVFVPHKQDPSKKSKFSIGDTVMLKKDRRQIKILDIVFQDDQPLYYGDSDTRYFFEDELE
ncbi:MAG: hypothetical protein GXY24_04820 [Bacteroidales bacterium]|nr:hypothetical protein [Bacteroidales bacterium]